MLLTPPVAGPAWLPSPAGLLVLAIETALLKSSEVVEWAYRGERVKSCLLASCESDPTHLIVLGDDGALLRTARLDRRASVDEAVLAIAVERLVA